VEGPGGEEVGGDEGDSLRVSWRCDLYGAHCEVQDIPHSVRTSSTVTSNPADDIVITAF
jgi:hypothetical protein